MADLTQICINGDCSGIPSGMSYEIVNSLPATGEAGKIYFVPSGGSSPEKYDEYVWVDGAFELLGGASTPSEPTHTYGFTIDQAESDPSTMVTYTDDAVGMTPFAMDLTTGVPNYGSWENAFFMPKPCMLKSDGTVDYYLDPADFTKKADGSASDVTDYSYDGNAMMEWPVIYMKIAESGDVISVNISNKEIDSDYHCWSNIKPDGSIGNFYTPIYNGSYDTAGKLRSMSGKTIGISKTAQQEIDAAVLNGSGWYTEVLADRMLINMLLVLMGKSLDTQTVFGAGFITGGSQSNMKLTGTADDKGLFYGLSDESTPVKVFGMENYWGQQYRRTAGYMFDNSVQKVKLTYGTEDGSSATGYNIDGTGYIEIPNSGITGSSGGYISKMLGNEYGMFPVAASGSDTTKYCDSVYYSNGTYYALFGGYSYSRRHCGAFFVILVVAASVSDWLVGASPSYR